MYGKRVMRGLIVRLSLWRTGRRSRFRNERTERNPFVAKERAAVIKGDSRPPLVKDRLVNRDGPMALWRVARGHDSSIGGGVSQAPTRKWRAS
jgi:hypothetical protein